jgi:AAA family ATP:ADP antiporter
MAETDRRDPPGGRLSPLERALRLFADVRAGEATTVLLMLSNLFLLLVAYYIIKTVREPLILTTGGAEVKSYAAAGQAVALMVFIPLYSWFSSRVDRLKLVVGFLVFFIVCIELFFLGAWARVPLLGFVFYIWVGIFSLATIAQFWSFGNDIYRRESGQRLFPLIVVGQTAGAPIGAKLAEMLYEAKVGIEAPYHILHIPALLLVAHLALYAVINRRQAAQRGQARAAGEALSSANGFSLVFANPYLRWAALLLVILNIVNTTGEYLISKSVVAVADAAVAADPGLSKGAFIGAFYGNYFFWVNVAAVVMQAFLVSRIVKYLGLAGVLLMLPFVALGAYGLIAAGASFALIRWAKTAENSTDYSVMNTARQLIWLPTTRDEKYKAKQALDTFFVRTGDVLSAALVFAGTTWLGWSMRGFALANMVLVLLWLVAAWFVLRYNRQLSAAREEETAA